MNDLIRVNETMQRTRSVRTAKNPSAPDADHLRYRRDLHRFHATGYPLFGRLPQAGGPKLQIEFIDCGRRSDPLLDAGASAVSVFVQNANVVLNRVENL